MLLNICITIAALCWMNVLREIWLKMLVECDIYILEKYIEDFSKDQDVTPAISYRMFSKAYKFSNGE